MSGDVLARRVVHPTGEGVRFVEQATGVPGPEQVSALAKRLNAAGTVALFCGAGTQLIAFGFVQSGSLPVTFNTLSQSQVDDVAAVSFRFSGDAGYRDPPGGEKIDGGLLDRPRRSFDRLHLVHISWACTPIFGAVSGRRLPASEVVDDHEDAHRHQGEQDRGDRKKRHGVASVVRGEDFAK